MEVLLPLALFVIYIIFILAFAAIISLIATIANIFWGALIGSIPLLCGLVKKRTKWGLIGLIASIVGMLVGGYIISFICCAVFVILIFCLKE